MSLILNIDTASEIAHINIAEDGVIIQEEKNTNQKDHAAFLQPAIYSLLKKAGNKINDLAAIAVNYGPGSYTGLRVGMASAKGLCFALTKPLVTVGALEMLTTSALSSFKESDIKSTLFCPMIDARRMEVFTAVYTSSLQVISPPAALVLDNNSYVKVLLNNPAIFFGSGSPKWRNICNIKNGTFVDVPDNSLALSILSFKKFSQKSFANLAYSEPLYIKEFL